MLADGHLVGDGSWTLRVLVTDLNVEKTLRVKGDTHIGGVMLNLVEEIGKYYFRIVLLMVIQSLTHKDEISYSSLCALLLCDVTYTLMWGLII